MELTGYIYTCSAGETFDAIARILFGHENYAADLMAANPEMSTTILFTGGEKLYIPSVEIPDEDDTDAMPAAAPWRE